MSDTRYTKDHEWIKKDGDAYVVGITNHAQEALGDVVFVELPEPGRTVSEGEAVAVVESVKAASDIYAPLSGEITEINTALPDDTALVNSSPEDKAWFFKIKPSDAADFEKLLSEEDYKKLL